MLRRIGAFSTFALLALPSLVGGARYSFDKDPDLPGHSDKYEVKGSSGYGCQVRDSEVILSRDPDRSGEDDGTLWTGETVFKINRYTTEEDNDPDVVCNGTFYMPTVFWIGPYMQGDDGMDNKFALGMLTWETNGTDKTDAWHVYRPCSDIDDPFDSPFATAFDLKAAAHYSNGTPPNDTTFGLSLIPPPPGSETLNT
jgi:hypothetical protein